MPNRNKEVDRFMENLQHPLKETLERVRSIILEADPHITEHIKWNAPSFCYQGDDRVTFKLYPQSRGQLVFHRGAKRRDDNDFSFEDSSGLLQWVANDRAIVTLPPENELDETLPALAGVVRQWMVSSH